MAVGRGVTAADVTTGTAHPQVDPARADPQAVLATGDMIWPLDVDLIEVCADDLAQDRAALARGLMSGVSVASSRSLRCSCWGGRRSCSPRCSGSSSVAKPGLGVASSKIGRAHV